MILILACSIYVQAQGGKTFISTLHTEDGTATTWQDKMRVAVDYFRKAVGTNTSRSRGLNWEALGYTPFNLEDLNMPFTMQELFSIIKSLPSEKALGPDGFIGLFYKKCWDIVKNDLFESGLGVLQSQDI